MTNQEAIRLMRNLPTMCEFTDAYGEPIDSDAYYEAVDMAISALQAQDSPKPTAGSVQNVQNEDLISRKAAIDAIEKNAYRHTYLDQIIDIVSELPSAQPERETAKFIRWMECKRTADYISYTPHCKCSKCGTEFLIETIKYCYICGARMER